MALTNAQRQARHRARQARLTYGQAIGWLVRNDDCTWSRDGGPVSVTAGFIADCYGRSTDDVRRDVAAILFLRDGAATVLVTDEDKGYDVIGPLHR